MLNTNSSFVLQSRTTGVTLKGQMLPTTLQLPGVNDCVPQRAPAGFFPIQ
jgi:hypothetical protein